MASGDVRDLREAREQLRRVVSRVEEDHPDMALQMRDLLAGSIDTLQGDKQLLELLQASIESNLSTIFHMLINDIDLQALKQAGLLGELITSAKVVATGEISRKVTLKGVAATKGALAAIQAAGGSVVE